MSINVTRLDDDSDWNDLVRNAPTVTPLHLSSALEVLADHSGTRLHRLVAYKGEEPVGLFPLFTKHWGPFVAAFSPPPNLKLPYLGPVLLNLQKLKRRRRELRQTRVIDAFLEWLETTHSPTFTNLRTTPGYIDARPFIWQSFDVVPRYTYIVDLERERDEILGSFSSDARKNITRDYDIEYTIETGDADGIPAVVEQVTARHEEQGERFPVDTALVTDLYESLPAGVVRPQTCRVDGEFVGGNINLALDGRSINWIGGAKNDHDLPVNDLLEWAYLEYAMDRGESAYDLAGANNRRISRYKSKYAPDLVPYFRIQSASPSASLAESAYSLFS